MGNSLQKKSKQLICDICFEPVVVGSYYQCRGDGPFYWYVHHTFCADCMASYIRLQVVHKNVTDVRCPGVGCIGLLNPRKFAPILSAPDFVKWCDLLCKQAVGWCQGCYCPNPKCSEAIINECVEKGKVVRWKCPSCKHEFCYDCMMPWHSGYACHEQKEMKRDENNVLFGKLLEANNWKRCPVCREAIELLGGGCGRVRCRCQTVFCYECGGRLPFDCCCTRKKEHWTMIFHDFYLCCADPIYYLFVRKY